MLLVIFVQTILLWWKLSKVAPGSKKQKNTLMFASMKQWQHLSQMQPLHCRSLKSEHSLTLQAWAQGPNFCSVGGCWCESSFKCLHEEMYHRMHWQKVRCCFLIPHQCHRYAALKPNPNFTFLHTISWTVILYEHIQEKNELKNGASLITYL